jgi:hypothetical protein
MCHSAPPLDIALDTQLPNARNQEGRQKRSEDTRGEDIRAFWVVFSPL